MNISIERRTTGVNFSEDANAHVVLWAPEISSASVWINNNRRLPLKKQDRGYWALYTDALQPGDRYHFLIDSRSPLPDPASLSQPDGVHGASEAIALGRMDDTDWTSPLLEQYIIYELHTGCFSPPGNFSGIAEKLPYLKELGINAVELMPVAQFPGSRNWGYDGVYPFAVHHAYGGARELQNLVAACHGNGMAVILDVVYNHVGPEGNYLDAYAPYFTDKYRTPWGRAVNYDDAWCDGVRRFVIENVLMWFRDFHIDALRLDAVHAIRDFSPRHILREMREYTDLLMQQTGRKHYLIAECDLNDTRYIDPPGRQGYGMDAQWADEFHHSLRVAAGNERNGYYADFNGIVHLAKAYRDAYVYDGIYSPHRKKTFGSRTTGHPGSRFVVCSQNHDQVGNRMLGERSSRLVSFDMQKLMAGAVMAAPYIPLLFMGEEWSASTPFLYFVSHPDPGLVAAVRKGRKEEFSAFHAAGKMPDPQSERTFLESKLNWEEHTCEPHSTMLRYYRALIALRKKHPALHRTDRHKMEVTADEASDTVTLHRWQEDEQVVCFMNFSKAGQKKRMPEAARTWYKLFDSSAPQWKGNAPAAETVMAGETLELPPESFLLYTDTRSYV